MGLCAATTLQDGCSPTSFSHFIVHSVLNVLSKLVSGFLQSLVLASQNTVASETRSIPSKCVYGGAEGFNSHLKPTSF